MPKRNNKSRSAIANGIPRMACTPEQAGHLLQGLRRDYRALTLKERNQVRAFMFGSSKAFEEPHSAVPNRRLMAGKIPRSDKTNRRISGPFPSKSPCSDD